MYCVWARQRLLVVCLSWAFLRLRITALQEYMYECHATQCQSRVYVGSHDIVVNSVCV